MAGYGVYQIPREFKDEDKWFKYFTKGQAVLAVLCLVADYRIVMGLASRGLFPFGVILAVLLTALVLGSVMIVLPVENFFLTGGGLTIAECLLRYFYRKRGRCLYTRNMEEDYGE